MTVEFSPSFPVSAEAVVLSTTSGDAAVAEFSLTSQPAGSTLTLGKLVDKQGKAVKTFTPPVPGIYQGNAYPGLEMCPDPAAGIWIKKLTPEQWTLHVGTALTLPIVPASSPHRATLRVTVVGDTVRAAALVNAGTPFAEQAAVDATVAAAVDALVGLTIEELDNDLPTNANILRAGYQAHRVYLGGGGSGVHNEPDNIDSIVMDRVYVNDTAIILVRELAAKMMGGHWRKGANASEWHDESDHKNVIAVAPGCVTLAQATVLCADLRVRAYSRHIEQVSEPDVHNVPDLVNVIEAPKPLSVAICAFLDYVVDNDPDAPALSGIVDAAARYGFA